jgi:hypothetical protein
VLRKVVGHYLDGKYTGSKVPTLREMFAVYAPASDRNDPEAYAGFVVQEPGVLARTSVDNFVDA